MNFSKFFKTSKEVTYCSIHTCYFVDLRVLGSVELEVSFEEGFCLFHNLITVSSIVPAEQNSASLHANTTKQAEDLDTGED